MKTCIKCFHSTSDHYYVLRKMDKTMSLVKSWQCPNCRSYTFIRGKLPSN